MTSKLAAVIRHEYTTIIKQPTFWLIMLAIPALIAAVIAISYFSSKSSESRIEEAARDIDNVVVIDKSGLIQPELVRENPNIELRDPASDDATIEAVRTGALDGAIVYPSDLLQTRSYDIYASKNDFTQNATLSTIGDSLLETSIFSPLGSAELITLAQQGANTNITSYDDGVPTTGIAEYIVPGAFIVLFYIVLVFSVNYMLTSVAEEKENRSMEMVLSYVPPRTLILGKLLGISLVTLTQLLFFGIVGFIAFVVARRFSDQLDLPLPADIDLSALVFDPGAIAIAFAVLILGFLLFAALMAGVGSMVPSAKDAGGLSFVFIAGAIIPFYTFSVLSTDPGSPITQFMTYFPTTAPTTLLIRNTFGNLGTVEAIVAVLVLGAFAFLAVLLAGKLFRLGALEYANRLSLKQIFK